MPVVVVTGDDSERDSIYVLSVMWLDENGCEPDDPSKRRFRTWGWFPTQALAEESIFANHADIYEDGYYNTVVLEEMQWGPLAVANAEHWYSAKAVRESSSHDGLVTTYEVRAIKKPKSLAGVVSFGMG